MTITLSLRFPDVLEESGLLCGGPAKNLHGVDIGPLSKTLVVKSLSLMVPKSIVSISGDIRLTSFIDGL